MHRRLLSNAAGATARIGKARGCWWRADGGAERPSPADLVLDFESRRYVVRVATTYRANLKPYVARMGRHDPAARVGCRTSTATLRDSYQRRPHIRAVFGQGVKPRARHARSAASICCAGDQLFAVPSVRR